ncbi:nucleotidyltransferase family protein [Paenibacillus sp. NPDC058174]|uniref:nucleotidyltransferase domain-containing protein n=1 Tax=Paenibacillus sp. NPDC058174 TaxID=3346366 RepID=UPI0036D8F8DC
MSSLNALDKRFFSKEFNMLLLLLRSGRTVTFEEAWEQSQQLDWNEFLSYVGYHHVNPVVYPLLKRLNDERQFVPPAIMQKMSQYFMKNTYEMLHLRGEMERIIQLLEGRGIRSLMLKGPVLAALLYGDISGRTSKDLDILVPKADIKRTEMLLMEEGYRLSEDTPLLLHNTERKTHHLSYFHYEKGIEIELHWRLNPDTIQEPDFEQLWARRQASSLHPSVHSLGNEDLFLYLVLHGTRHGWSCLRWLLDIDRIVAKPLAGDTIQQLLQIYRGRDLIGLAFVLARELLGTKLPDALAPMSASRKADKLAPYVLIFMRERAILHPKPEKRDIAIHYNRYMLATMPFSQKGLYLLNKIYPSSWDAEVLPLPKALHFLYFPLRPFLWIWRQMKRQSI